MTRRITLLTLYTIMVVVLLGVTTSAATKPVILKWGHCQPVGHPATTASELVAKLVNEKTNGQVKIEIYPASQLGSAHEQIQGLMMGSQDMAYDGPGVMSKFLPKIAVLEAPFLYDDYEHMHRVLSTDLIEGIYAELRKATGIRVLDTWYYGVRHVTTSKKPVQTVQDMKGLKLRVPEIAAYMETMKAMGASPTPMPFGELYLALQTGVVDGQENPVATIDSGKLYEVQKHISLTGHITNLQFVMISDKALKKLTDEQQQILIDAIQEAGRIQDETILASESSLLEKFKSSGVEIHEVDRSAFREASNVVYEKFATTWGKDTIEKILALK